MTNIEFKFIEKINLGANSDLELIEVEAKKYILKTYISQDGEDTIAKRNREYFYHKELQKLGLNHFVFYFEKYIQPNRLCFEYLENFTTFDTVDKPLEFDKLSKYIQNLWNKSKNSKTIFVDNKGCKEVDIGEYFEYLKNEISNTKIDPKFIQLANRIIEDLKINTQHLTLLHSDFRENNIGLIEDMILFFDSGICPYLYGHKYHDISKITMYYPEGLIFSDQAINGRIKPFVEAFEFDCGSNEFQKFCYIQSLLVYDNPWTIRAKEITEYLYKNLN